MKKTIQILLIILILGATAVLGFWRVKLLAMSSENASRAVAVAKQPQATSVKVLFVGDMMFDRWIRQSSAAKGADFLFSDFKPLFSTEDLIVGNLEGPITDSASISAGTAIGVHDNYIFTFSPSTAATLYAENIRLVNLGNNHISNFGAEGVAQTKKYLRENQVNYFGDVGDSEPRFFIENLQGFRIAFLNYNQFAAHSEKNALADLAAVKNLQPDFVVVYTHWGTEYVSEPNVQQKRLAHEFVDAGADLIIGSHPHVVETKEEYQGKTIYYSLGNFIFDQYFEPATQRGLAVEVEFKKEHTLSFTEYPVTLEANGQTKLD